MPDFPKPGIVFKDITPVLANPAAFKAAIDLLAERGRDLRCEAVLAIESRGFILGAPLALELGLPLQLVRKRGKLPRAAHKVSYELEYGIDHLEVHADAIRKGGRYLIVDDVIATGRNGGRGRELGRAAGRNRGGVPIPDRAHVSRGSRQARRRRRGQLDQLLSFSTRRAAQWERFKMNSDSHSRPSALGPSACSAATARCCVSAARRRAPSTPSVEG